MRKLIIASLIVLTACADPTKLKTVNWNDSRITWDVIDGGATTSYLWRIHYTKPGGRKHKILTSYSTPYITDISVTGDILNIHCLVGRNSTDIIKIDLNKIDEYIRQPIKYERSMLLQSNEHYKEPEFAKRARGYQEPK